MSGLICIGGVHHYIVDEFDTTNADHSLCIENTDTVGAIINRLGTNTSTTNFEVRGKDNLPIFKVAGDHQVTSVGNIDANAGIDIDADGQPLTIGAKAGGDISIVHRSNNSSITNSTGNFTIENTPNNKKIILKLGTKTSATVFEVQDSDGDVLFSVDGTGTIAPSLAGPSNFQMTTVTTITQNGDRLYTAAEVLGGVIIRDPGNNDVCDTFPSAAAIVAAISSPVVGLSFSLKIFNIHTGANWIEDLKDGNGISWVIPTESNSGIAPTFARTILFVLTNVGNSTEAISLYSEWLETKEVYPVLV